MPVAKKRVLSEGHRKALGTNDHTDRLAEDAERLHAQSIVPDTNPLHDRYEMLRDIPRTTIRKAWFTMAHLLLGPGSRVVDMGCQGGAMVYAMAVLHPQHNFIGVDRDKKLIAQAMQNYKLPNLEFVLGDVGAPDLLPHNSIDAIVNSFILHEIYSGEHYNDRSVVQVLQNQMGLLKPQGVMFLRDFAMPAMGEFILMEMPDVPSTGADLHSLSEADLLVWYSEHARPRQDPGCHGFFLEELPPRFPRTRLFRVPSKWAYEFIMRKDEREIWEDELPKEYTFFTESEYRRTLRSLGARPLYTAPHWDDQYVKSAFEGHFRLYEENGTQIGTPPTSFIAVAQKLDEHLSMELNERRPSQKTNSSIRIQAMRNEVDGRIVDVISRDVSMTEILPWRMDDDGNLNIFLHIGVPRGIVNAVPRNGRDLDGRRWSGHMTEAIAISTEIISNIPEGDFKGALHLLRDAVGLKPLHGQGLENGPFFYPAPDFIDERIETRFVQVEKPSGTIEPKALAPDIVGFREKGRIVEISAQSILNAISVGAIPNAQLELQIEALYSRLGLKAETWVESPLVLAEIDIPSSDTSALLTRISESDDRYKPSRTPAGQWRQLQSTFVEEGQINGAMTGLSSRNLDFVVSDENTENIAVVMPLAKNISGEVMAGYMTDYLPIPQRHKGTGLTVTVPSIPLPREVTSMDSARAFIASRFQVKPENVTKLGESYFCYAGLTPQRIYPFAVTAPAFGDDGPVGVEAYAPIRQLGAILYLDNSISYLKTISMVSKSLGATSDLSPTWDFGKKLAAAHERPIGSHGTDLRGITINPAVNVNGDTSGKASGSNGGGNGGSAGGAASESAPSLPEDRSEKLRAEKPLAADIRKPRPK